MNPNDAMDDLRPRTRRASPRTLATVAAAALIAIAVAGILIVVLRGQSKASDAQLTAPASGPAASAARAARHAGDPNQIVFAPDSDQLSPEAVEQIREMAESAKGATSAVVLSGKIESTSDRAARMELAKKRITVVRRELQARGIAPERLRVEVAEYPVGRIRPGEADKVEMSLR